MVSANGEDSEPCGGVGAGLIIGAVVSLAWCAALGLSYFQIQS